MGHDHKHDRDHDHDHDHPADGPPRKAARGGAHAGHDHGPPPTAGRAFAIATALNLSYVVVEAVYGVIAHSMALLADAAHNLGDVMGLLLAWGAAALATRARSTRRTYGFRKATVFAALVNSLLIVVAAGGVGWEAITRLFEPPPEIHGGTVAIVAAIGVVFNGLSAALFARTRHKDINARAAYFHLLSDALVGIGVTGAGVLVMWTGRLWIDPVASLVVTAVILVGTVGLLRETANLAMAGVPAHIDLAAVERFLAGQPCVTAVHDLHVWSLSTTEVALTAHLVLPWPATPPEFLATVSAELEERFSIHHVTLQLEAAGGPACAQTGEGVI
ncbi:MAG TPA: cation diffusion facilitator family transporter [Kofleriaceae bacterium]|nr:cation diffusion facilitator family transporter [Kofleriaceae bacterium]